MSQSIPDKNGEYLDISCPADLDCEHEEEVGGPVEWGDVDDLLAWGPCWYIRCKNCGGVGLVRDDDEALWMDEFGNFE